MRNIVPLISMPLVMLSSSQRSYFSYPLEVTKLLTCFAQACHDLVPPEVCRDQYALSPYKTETVLRRFQIVA